MHESVLRDYFLGRADAHALQTDLKNSRRQFWLGRTLVTQVVVVSDLPNDSNARTVIQPQYLVRLCDEVLAGNLRPSDLELIAFVLLDFMSFEPSPDATTIIIAILDCWNTPSANYPLTRRNVRKFRDWVLSGKKALDAEDGWSPSQPDAMSCHTCGTPRGAIDCPECGCEPCLPDDEEIADYLCAQTIDSSPNQPSRGISHAARAGHRAIASRDPLQNRGWAARVLRWLFPPR